MIVVRDIFRLKFGQTKEAMALWRQAIGEMRKAGFGPGGVRLLTDLIGAPYYTVIVECAFDSLAQWEKAHHDAHNNADWRAIYQKIIPLTEEGRREILAIVEQVMGGMGGMGKYLHVFFPRA